ncbi:hypothetical protein L602_000200001170 [Cupriavidus gilardii J11]|uniref:Uncharacterized protein n=1 Tax=Cupriavidus gilardii J11 TaxID=936133 RepID=A0A562BNC4_9BURK|nr:hypothetical protein [Cupriavidus gilardii]TWG86716.1 hypothetical protein L602_000200001170 [Cupriavidus gilardii J11]
MITNEISDIANRQLGLRDHARCQRRCRADRREAARRIGRIVERFDTARRRLTEGYANVPEETGMAEIDAAVEELRRARG